MKLCLSCSVNEATSEDGTVPLCSECAALATNPRGVEFSEEEVDPRVFAAEREAILAELTKDAQDLGLYN